MLAPDFSLPDQSGQTRTLSDSAGKWRVIYFYPKDDTPGCTTEACNFRDHMTDLTGRGVVVYGISKDSVKSHRKFADKHHLNFPLLADESSATIQAYGAWGQKKFMGREFAGILRRTYLINPAGEIVKTYEGMDLNQHAQQILSDISSLS